MAIEVVLRTSFTPPVRLGLSDVLGSFGKAKGEDGQPLAGGATQVLHLVRPSIEFPGGLRAEPWGPPIDWRIPLLVTLGLVGLGAWGLFKLASKG